MSDTANIQNNKLTKEQKKLIYDSLATNIIRFQEYRLDHKCVKSDGAVLFEYLCYNSYKRFAEDRTSEGFFYHSYERIEQEYGIGKDRVRKIVAYLKQNGIVETKIKGFPKNTHYRIRFDSLSSPNALKAIFRVSESRLKELAAHYHEIAKVVNLSIESAEENLQKEYKTEIDYFKLLSEIFYEEQRHFNQTVPVEYHLKKKQPKANEKTYLNIRDTIYFVYYSLEEARHSEEETKRRFGALVNGFRAYCGALFLYSCEASSNSDALRKIIERIDNYDMVNYASSIRNPIAYFFAEHSSGVNHISADFIDWALQNPSEFSSGYFYSRRKSS
ncbi:hypothetical protein [Spirosoma foliorum]|uniref:Uncharacterized protein n=1 Tax=Spirosoma foliorum TaxID=2710596 RepID=A0A7G5GTV0_9BACT|nr:hypothetical protein [Spirosoma foliorum]QMW02292.1 hypothetical protein H3H32_30945 [Spirosoma foliorum]